MDTRPNKSLQFWQSKHPIEYLLQGEDKAQTHVLHTDWLNSKAPNLQKKRYLITSKSLTIKKQKTISSRNFMEISIYFRAIPISNDCSWQSPANAKRQKEWRAKWCKTNKNTAQKKIQTSVILNFNAVRLNQITWTETNYKINNLCLMWKGALRHWNCRHWKTKCGNPWRRARLWPPSAYRCPF